MTMKKKWSAQEKAKIALEALKGLETQSQLTARYGVHSTQLFNWKKQLKEGLPSLFKDKKRDLCARSDKELIEALYQQIGQLKVELDWLKKKQTCSVETKRHQVDKDHAEISVERQCELLGIHRSGLYYQSESENAMTLDLLRLIDEEYTRHPFLGTRRMVCYLREQGYDVNRKRIQRLYGLLGIEAIYPKPNLSRQNKEDERYPYLLSGLAIERCNQVWSTDITYIRISCGFVYLMAIIDWHSRYVLDWEISTSLEADFCVDTFERTLLLGSCEIFNTDLGSQFTSQAFTGLLKAHDVRISRDGKGRYLDNIFVERLWRSVKYECIYLNEFNSVIEVKQALNDYFDYYNHRRHHQALDYNTPASIYLR